MGKRDYAMLRLLWDNALRRAEVCGLDRADFHPKEARLLLKGKGRIDKEPIDLAAATVEAISDWLVSMGESKSPALFVSSRDTRLSVDRLYQIVGGLAAAAGIAGVTQPASGTDARSNTGSRWTSVKPASASAARWRMPFDPRSVNARYLPRLAALTDASPIEKSRTCNS